MCKDEEEEEAQLSAPTDDDEGEEGEKAPPVEKHSDLVERRLSDFDYLVSMALIKLSEEEKEKLLKERDEKNEELAILQAKAPSDLWLEDLENFMHVLDVSVRKTLIES